MKLKTLKQIRTLKNKRVLLRVDFNVPISGGKIIDDSRIRASIPTIKYLLKKGAKVIIATHLGRPKKADPKLSTERIGEHLQKLLKKKVFFVPSAGKAANDDLAVKNNIIMLENLRFDAGEQKNDPKFILKLASLADVFVNDAFGMTHRKHASTYGIAELLPSYAGLLMESEIKALSPLLKNPARPLALIMGGAKIKDKIGVIKYFFKKADFILVGGGMANTFLVARGFDVGGSFYEKDKIEEAREIMLLAEKYHEKFYTPVDAVVADKAEEKSKTIDLPLEDMEGSMKMLDIGRMTQKQYIDIIEKSKTVIWNGPMGVYEFTPFQSGTKALAEALASKKEEIKAYIGGGDSLDSLRRLKIPTNKFTHVSTGGGAMLEFLQGKKSPVIKTLTR